MNIEDIRDFLDDEAIILDGLDEAIIGHSDDGILIYSYQILEDLFCKQGMEREEASEWISYNILGLKGNGAGFIMCFQ